MRSIIARIATLVTFGCLATTTITARELSLSADRFFSPYVGADLFIDGLNIYQTADDIWLSGTEGDTSGWMVLGRIAKLFILEDTLASWAMVGQHEYFGHGARAREFHLSNVGYRVRFNHGYTSFSTAGYKQLNVNQKAALATGGMEATSILANQIQNSWLSGDTIDRREAILYLRSSLDQTSYVIGTSGKDLRAERNDVSSYIRHVNQWHGDNTLTLGNLKRKIAWDLFNPMLYLSAYSLYDYVWEGNPNVNFGRWYIGDCSYMPTTRTLLAPWGPELQLLNHLYTQESQYIGVHFRTGRTGGKMSHGLDIIVTPMIEYQEWWLGNRASFWHQPHILKSVKATQSANKYGFADFITLNLNFNRVSSIFTELGYKTSGFMAGAPLARGVVFRAGIKVNFTANKKTC